MLDSLTNVAIGGKDAQPAHDSLEEEELKGERCGAPWVRGMVVVRVCEDLKR